MGILCLYWDKTVESWQDWVERGRWDRESTSRRELNSGRLERSCAVCRRTNHEAIGTDKFKHFCSTNEIEVWHEVPNEATVAQRRATILHIIGISFLNIENVWISVFEKIGWVNNSMTQKDCSVSERIRIFFVQIGWMTDSTAHSWKQSLVAIY